MREPFLAIITAAFFIDGCSKQLESPPVATPVPDSLLN